MASQACSASANVLKGDPPTLMAGLLKLMERQEATKPGFPWSPGPLVLSLLITNEKPRSLALHISSSCVAGAMRMKCMCAFHHPASQNGPRFSGWGRQPGGRFSSGQGLWGHRPEAKIRRPAGAGVPAIAAFSRQRGGGLAPRRMLAARGRGLRVGGGGAAMPGMSAKSREVIWGGRIMGADIRVERPGGSQEGGPRGRSRRGRSMVCPHGSLWRPGPAVPNDRPMSECRLRLAGDRMLPMQNKSELAAGWYPQGA
jgi:hypothetical protein